MQSKIGKLVIVRHGESQWNKDNLFTGKADVHLTGKGFNASEALGALIRDIEIHKVIEGRDLVINDLAIIMLMEVQIQNFFVSSVHCNVIVVGKGSLQ